MLALAAACVRAAQARRPTPRASTSRTTTARSTGRRSRRRRYRFVYAKATEGTRSSIRRTRSTAPARKSFGLRVGAYHFARPAGATDAARIANAIAQADFFLTVAQPQPGELPPGARPRDEGRPHAGRRCRPGRSAWLDEIAARTGVSAVVYASPNFWKTALARHAERRRRRATGSGSRTGRRTRRRSFPARTGAASAGRSGSGATARRCRASRTASTATASTAPIPAPVAIPPYPTRRAGVRVAADDRRHGADRRRRSPACPARWTGGKPVTFLYQWQRCDAAGRELRADRRRDRRRRTRRSPTTSATRSSLSVTAQTLRGAVVATSPPTVAVVAGGAHGDAARRDLARRRSPARAQAGQTLTSSVGTWSGAPTSFTYQWRRCDATGAQCTADRRRDDVDVHALAGRHRLDDLARRHRHRQGRLDLGDRRRRRLRSSRRRCPRPCRARPSRSRRSPAPSSRPTGRRP